jgi:hypothetical protein
LSARCAGRPGPLTGERPRTARIRRPRAFSKTVGSGPRVVLCNNFDLVTVDFIGGEGAKRSISCLKDDDGDHERGGERGGEGVCIFAGHLFWLLLGGEGPSPALTGTRRPKDSLTSPGAFGLAPNPAGGTGLPVVRPLAG